MIRRAALWACLLATCLPGGSLAADLDFPQRHLQATPAPGAKTVEFTFPFTNQGTAPITITDIQVGCNCVAAHLEQKTFAPGERGAIPVTYTIAGAFGVQQKAIRVISTDQDHPVIALVVEVRLPEGPTITPRFLHWSHQAPLTAQTVEISVPADATWKIIRAYDKKEKFTTVFAPSAQPGKMVLTVTPLQTERAVTGIITLETDTGLVFSLFAQVRPVPVGAGPGQAP